MQDERPDADPPAGEPEPAAGDERFVDDLIERGEAAPLDENGELPPGATHELIPPEHPGEAPKVVRRRFSAF